MSGNARAQNTTTSTGGETDSNIPTRAHMNDNMTISMTKELERYFESKADNTPRAREMSTNGGKTGKTATGSGQV
jgi:hypothetical protein